MPEDKETKMNQMDQDLQNMSIEQRNAVLDAGIFEDWPEPDNSDYEAQLHRHWTPRDSE